jgi:hypothetical protein
VPPGEARADSRAADQLIFREPSIHGESKDLIAFYFCVEGSSCKKLNLFANIFMRECLSLDWLTMGEQAQPTKHVVNLSSTCIRSDYLRWESHSVMIQSTKHTLNEWSRA